ncbi:hypothetical protein CRE_12344 [Caenorhabditis remanei]|uniref:VWFA domain-containing protein n=1 Tax=Caenorhabditis remanei TaxID=31234 RepID=E3NKS0_CAERE|nr:hypothetical protein CRE_12344 [Caenorhabditis remanei]
MCFINELITFSKVYKSLKMVSSDIENVVRCLKGATVIHIFSATDGNDTPVITDPMYMCNYDNFSRTLDPPYNNGSSSINLCDVVFLLDLDKTFTSEENYTQVQAFISDATETCMNRGVGYAVFAYPMFNETPNTETVCCNADQCKTQFGFMPYRSYVGNYSDMDPVQPVTSQFNFSYVLIDDLKKVGSTKKACLYNNYVLITNRIFNMTNQTDVVEELSKIMGVGCITFTVVVVGNPDITTEMIYQQYNAQYSYVVPNFNCLDMLKVSFDNM